MRVAISIIPCRTPLPRRPDLTRGRRLSEGRVRLAGRVDAVHSGDPRHLDLEQRQHDHQAREADIRHRDRVAVAERAGVGLRGETLLDGLQAGGQPVGTPSLGGLGVETTGFGQVGDHPRGQQRVGVGGQHGRQRAHPRPPVRGVGQEGHVGVHLLQELQDGERLRNGRRSGGLAVDQRRDGTERVDGQEGRAALLARVEVHEALVGREALEVERHTHPVGGRGAPEREQFETSWVGHRRLSF